MQKIKAYFGLHYQDILDYELRHHCYSTDIAVDNTENIFSLPLLGAKSS